jgi:UDP-GlcNAc:undecaprenyl-phosphate GlcNAc-1-phosphate transferase
MTGASQSEVLQDLFPLLLGAALSLVGTPVARHIARKTGFVAAPREDRWHRQPTALLGGPAIVFACLAAFFAANGFRLSPLYAAWVVGGLTIAALGLLDDVLGLRPASKLIGQIIAALVPIYAGLRIGVFHPLLAFFIALLWIVGIANAFNLLDNMDGLAAGVAAIASAFLTIHALRAGNATLARAGLGMCGAALGFLVYNFNPASIFMGDGGSLFLGFSLGTLSLMDLGSRPVANLSIIAVPLFVLAIPIFDTALVTVLRVFHRRSIARGGRDHSSHRLVSLGLSEKRAVLTLYAFSAAMGLLSLLLPRFPASLVVLVTLLSMLLVYYFGAYLGSVDIYRSDPGALDEARSRGFFVLDTFIAYKRWILDVSADLVIVAISYLGAYLLRYEGVLSPINLNLILRSLPFLIAIRLLCFFAFGLYRTVPGAFSLHDFLASVKAVFASSVIFITGLVLVARFKNYSRAVMVIDGVLTLAGITFARIALRSLQEIFGGLSQAQRRRVLIVGAGKLGEAAAQLLRAEADGSYHIVGFLDDNPEKIGRRLHGLPVIGRLDEMDALIQNRAVDLVIMASSKIPVSKRRVLEDVCQRLAIERREIRLA